MLPCAPGQVAELDQLRDLTGIGAVVDAARTQRVTEADRNVKLTQNRKNIVIVFVERIFVAGHHHPRKQQRAAAGNDVHFSALAPECFHGAAVDTGVNRHEIDAFLGMCADNPQKVLRGDLEQILFKIADRIIHRHRADHCGRFFDKRCPEGIGLAVIAEIHDRFRAEFQRHIDLFHFQIVVLRIAGNAEIDIDLGFQPHTDALG